MTTPEQKARWQKTSYKKWKKFQKWKRPWWTNWRLDKRVKRDHEHGRLVKKKHQQAKIAYLVAQGWNQKAIAEHLGMGYRTVKRFRAESLARVTTMSEIEIIQADNVPPPHQMDTPAMRALEYRKMGWSYRRIAEEMDMTPSHVTTLVMEELTRIDADEVRSTDKARRLMIEQLDELLAAIWPRAIRGELEAMLVALKFMERRSKLIGLDAPQTVDIEMQIRRAAQELNIDPDEAVLAAQDIVKNRLTG